MSQEKLALAIVGIATLVTARSLFRAFLAAPLARLLLKRGSVKWAMRLNSKAKKPGCDGC